MNHDCECVCCSVILLIVLPRVHLLPTWLPISDFLHVKQAISTTATDSSSQIWRRRCCHGSSDAASSLRRRWWWSVRLSPTRPAAYDTVDHDILLTRLRVCYGVRGVVLDWLHSYLTHRVECQTRLRPVNSDGLPAVYTLKAAFRYSSKLQTWLSTCVSVSKARRKQVESMSKASCKLA